MSTLYELTADFAALDALLDDSGGEITDTIEVFLAELERNLEEKADGYAAYIRYLDAVAKVNREESQRLTVRARTAENRSQWLRDTFQRFMEQRQMRRLETERNTFTISAVGGKRPLEITDADDVPIELCEVRYEPNKEQIREKLEAGEEVPGARLAERKQTLRIK